MTICLSQTDDGSVWETFLKPTLFLQIMFFCYSGAEITHCSQANSTVVLEVLSILKQM